MLWEEEPDRTHICHQGLHREGGQVTSGLSITISILAILFFILLSSSSLSLLLPSSLQTSALLFSESFLLLSSLSSSWVSSSSLSRSHLTWREHKLQCHTFQACAIFVDQEHFLEWDLELDLALLLCTS